MYLIIKLKVYGVYSRFCTNLLIEVIGMLSFESISLLLQSVPTTVEDVTVCNFSISVSKNFFIVEKAQFEG